MSYALRIWAHPEGQPAPSSLEQAGQLMLALEIQPTGVNPKFVALAREMLRRCPARKHGGASDDGVCLSDPVAQVESLAQAVWTVEIPQDDRVRVAHFLVQQAHALGLTVLNDQLGMAFLPSGQVLPEQKAPVWAGLTRELAADAKPFTKADFRKMMATFLSHTLAPHGFVKRRSEGADAEFARPASDGLQLVQLYVKGSSPRYETVVYCHHRNEAVESVFADLFGAFQLQGTLWFNLAAFEGKCWGGFFVNGLEDIRRWMKVLEGQALPILDAAREPGALDHVMNTEGLYPLPPDPLRPQLPQSLDAFLRTQGNKLVFKPLIVAWMAGNPRFEAMVAQCREIIRPRVDASEADLGRLLEYLRQHVPRSS